MSTRSDIETLIKLIGILKDAKRYGSPEEESVMISVTETQKNKHVPVLFQIIKNFDGTNAGKYSVTRREDGSHNIVLSEIVTSEYLVSYVLKNYNKSITPVDMEFLFGPYVVLSYKF